MQTKLPLLLIVVALILGGAGLWFWQRNTYSKEALKLELLAPQSIAMGEEFSYTVKYKNNGDARLEKAQLVFEYPTGSIPSDGGSSRITKNLEDIYPGQEQTHAFKVRLFGKEGEIQEAKAFLQYVPKSLNAKFESRTSATTVIASVPLNFELDLPSRIENGQQFEFDLNYFSNSTYPLSDLRIKIEYPAGFQLKKASPSPLGENEWKVGVLNKAQGGRISLAGTVEGNAQEVKIFKATLGSWKEGVFTLLKESVQGIEITKPKLLISQTVNGSGTYTASPGDALHYVISFKNVGDKNFENLFLVTSLEGRPFDLDSVKVDRGKLQQGDNSVVWEAKDVSKLRFLGKGEEGRVEFWVNVHETWEMLSPQDKNFTLRNRIILSDATEAFEIKVNSKLAMEQAAHFQDEVFGNAGPLPPRAGSQTTYTVTWKVQNFSNDVQNVKVRSLLPQGVSLSGKIFPQDASLTFDSASREIVWEVGDMTAGTGVFAPAPSVAFQIALVPSSSQRGSPAQLMGEARVTGDDVFSQQLISAFDVALDTALPDDPTAQGKGSVQ